MQRIKKFRIFLNVNASHLYSSLLVDDRFRHDRNWEFHLAWLVTRMMRLDIDYRSHRASRGETIFCRIDEQFLIKTKCFKKRDNPPCWISILFYSSSEEYCFTISLFICCSLSLKILLFVIFITRTIKIAIIFIIRLF